jgi:hypothetical protein
MQRALLAAFGVVMLAVAGCTTEPNGDVRTEYEQQRVLWEATSTVDYTYQLRISCFCPGGPFPVLVTVEGGIVAALEWVDPPSDFPEADPDTDFYGKTIDDLYDIIRDALDTEADGIEVTYDPAGPYPATINIDFFVDAVDDEITYEASSLTAPVPTN